MKKLLTAAVALFCVSGAALAGPNAGGTLILHANPAIVYTVDTTNYCGQGGLTVCDGAIDTVAGNRIYVAFAIAAFHPSSSPALAGLTFGVAYPGNIFIVAAGSCGDFELADDTWPASGSGTAVTFSTAENGHLVECYWFAAYNYYSGSQSGSLCLTPHPIQGANFADDAVPANLDPSAGLGCLGFDEPGSSPCPTVGVPTGGCCLPNFGGCVVVTADECAAQGGTYQGDGSDCDPDPCPPPPRVGACCIGTDCIVTTAEDCAAQGGNYQGDDTTCPNEACNPVATEQKTWGGVKRSF
jgi:hypothetical protein